MGKINVTRSSMPSYEGYINKIKQLWETRHLTNMGVFHEELELKLLEYLKVKNAVLYTNGHTALEYALETIRKKGEIITTPFTFASTTQAIIRTGNTPVFCDIKDDFTIDESKIEALITKKTVAIAPVHVYGNVCNVEKIEQIAQKYNIKVIYDAAHVFGVEHKNKGIGSYGDISMFSFHATKVFHTIEGGALTFNDNGIKAEMIAMRNFGQVTPEQVDFVGGNGKMDEFRSAMGLCMLEIVDEEIVKRKKVYQRYLDNLKDIKGVKLNYIQKNTKPNYAYFPVVFDNYKYNRDEIFDLLKKHAITARKYFYPLTSDFEAYKNLFSIQETPIAKEIASKVLCLPIYPDLELANVDIISNIIKNGGL